MVHHVLLHFIALRLIGNLVITGTTSCPNLATWRYGSSCAFPHTIVNPEDCHNRKVWACCQVGDATITCTTGFHKSKDEQYGWRSGTSERFSRDGRGKMTGEELLALGRGG
ncbi:hypothetical protein SVAN01_08345 [Stagonosporopsis vannaccii]|nr:hypothetical protein SVAN01_08345 [Stagonosporopsis vannaccii]